MLLVVCAPWPMRCLRYAHSPIGHLHCGQCLVRYILRVGNATKAPCPTCRAEFPVGALRFTIDISEHYLSARIAAAFVVVPDKGLLPEQLRTYVLPSLRRVYIPPDPARPGNIENLKAQISQLEDRLRAETMAANFSEAYARNADRREKESREQLAKTEKELADARKESSLAKQKLLSRIEER